MAIIYGIPHTVRILENPQCQVQSSKSPKVRGKKGELKALDKLSELDNSYHILCGMRIVLGRRLKAQIDFVVVSKRGIVSIEVKNWGDKFLSKHLSHQIRYGVYSPHSQADNSGKVLWVALKSNTILDNPPVTKVLLATHGNMQHDSQYKFVNVTNLKNINSFIQTRYEKLSDEQVQKVIEYLIGYIPNCEINYSLRTCLRFNLV